MPWCEDCAKYYAPTAMNADGTCPSCGRLVETPEPRATVTAKNLDLNKLAGDEAKAPWHFKLLIVLLVAYLGWRIVYLFI